jgi:hypothetical protein
VRARFQAGWRVNQRDTARKKDRKFCGISLLHARASFAEQPSAMRLLDRTSPCVNAIKLRISAVNRVGYGISQPARCIA